MWTAGATGLQTCCAAEQAGVAGLEAVLGQVEGDPPRMCFCRLL